MPQSLIAAHQSFYCTSNTDISDHMGDLETMQLSRRMDCSKNSIFANIEERNGDISKENNREAQKMEEISWLKLTVVCEKSVEFVKIKKNQEYCHTARSKWARVLPCPESLRPYLQY